MSLSVMVDYCLVCITVNCDPGLLPLHAVVIFVVPV